MHAERERSQDEIAQQMNRMFRRYNNLRVFATQEQTISVGLGGRGANPVQFVLQNLNFEKLKEKIPVFMEEVRKNPTFMNTGYKFKIQSAGITNNN